jgi:hypothetical protein
MKSPKSPLMLRTQATSIIAILFFKYLIGAIPLNMYQINKKIGLMCKCKDTKNERLKNGVKNGVRNIKKLNANT